MPTKNLSMRKIRNTPVSEIGFGAVGIPVFYGAIESDEERFKVLDAAYEEGCTYWDIADVYGDSENLIGKWFKRTRKRDEIFLGTKFGYASLDAGTATINGTPEYVKSAFERSSQQLGVETVDLYYLHRTDKNVPIEHTVAAMAELVEAGKVKYLGLSEASASTLRRAHAVHPISAVQVEYLSFTLDIEDEKIGLLKACRELGITTIAYSPLGRGLLSGQIKSPDDLEKESADVPIIHHGDRHPATVGQASLAWLLAQGEDIIPIPGTKKIKENHAAAQVKLTPEIANKADVMGVPRYPLGMLQLLFVDTPSL
ncbi:hypothetical protein AX15_001645 [Amanita polypyramis BW_CC]|nr:hypothetical protein AX15_001645 [Amanita polypyramis BW_CC]